MLYSCVGCETLRVVLISWMGGGPPGANGHVFGLNDRRLVATPEAGQVC